ncbi:ATP-binding protein [Treponema sp. C6A8]|uniref:ATP-binding protein n=1 Tax=Treponema sp. C6A8 TaxID=1410609 RepID=UPI00048845FC|nr:AAA family ATPase [Treponema sp. C6A8]
MLYREIWQELKNWKERTHHPLIVRGLRQIGKTYIVKQFGKEFYENCIYLDLRYNSAVHKAFEGDFNVDQMVLSITSVEKEARFIPGKTLLILDEIQDCPNARSSLKYWDIDGRFDVICTGSFLGVKGFRTPYKRGIPVGYEEQLTMYPLSFHEFLINAGMDKKVLDYVEKSITEKTVIEETIHNSMRSLYLQYLITGGMPEVLNTFFETHDLNAVREVQQRILNSIKDDFGRYKDEKGNDKINEVLKLRSEACLNSLPAQLSKEYKKFQYSLVDVKGHSPEKADGLQYLEDVGLVVRSYNTRQISYPLEAEKISTEFKVFCIDTGLLVSMLGNDVPAKILNGDLGAYKGAVAENMVAAAFAKSGQRLYYFHAPSGSPELDFLYEKNGEVIITECKSSNNRATSMKFVIANAKKYGSHPAIKIADTNVGKGPGYDTLPLYALGFINEKSEKYIIPVIDVKNIKIPE